MNEVFLDTETTGLSFNDGHKIVEVACIETKDLIPTGKVFHKLVNPKRNMPEEAFKVHGFSEDFLKDKETFDKIETKIIYSTIVELDNEKNQKEEMEKIILVNVPSKIYSELRQIFVFLFENSGFKDVKISETVDFEKLYKMRKIQ